MSEAFAKPAQYGKFSSSLCGLVWQTVLARFDGLLVFVFLLALYLGIGLKMRHAHRRFGAQCGCKRPDDSFLREAGLVTSTAAE